MGLFLDLSGIIGRDEMEVVSSLTKYSNSVNGGLQKADIDSNHKNFCVIETANGNAAIFYPAYFTAWDECSRFISKDLTAPVFSCHIHDGDLWMYIMYVNGENIDQFCPIPDYWDQSISKRGI
jgi:hypothetical protein